MNNDIKKILNKLELCCEYKNPLFVKFEKINQYECKSLLDYITNLQEKYEEADNDRHKLFEQKEKAKDKIKQLQEENERLKEENKHIFANVNDDKLLISNAMNYAEAQDYKSRIDKAIEYIKEKARNNCWIYQYEANDLINILGGEK